MEGLSHYAQANDKAKYHGNSKIDRDAGIFHEITDGKHFEFHGYRWQVQVIWRMRWLNAWEVLSWFCFDQHKEHQLAFAGAKIVDRE